MFRFFPSTHLPHPAAQGCNFCCEFCGGINIMPCVIFRRIQDDERSLAGGYPEELPQAPDFCTLESILCIEFCELETRPGQGCERSP